MKTPIIRARQDRVSLGIALVLIAYFVFSFIDTGAKWLALAGIPAMQLAFMRYVGHFAISLTLILKGGASLQNFKSDRMFLTVLRGATLAFSTMLNFVAIQYLPLTLTSTILFLSPIIVCALSWPMLGERVGVFRSLAILVGFAGILVAIRPASDGFHWAVFLSFGSAFGFSIYQILTRMLAGTVASDVMQFYTGFIGTLVLAPFAFFLWENPSSLRDWIIMFSLGVLGFVGHEFLTRAHGFAAANQLSPFGYSFMIYLTIISYLVFDQLPNIWTIVGAVIVVAAGLTIWARERRLAQTRIIQPR